MVFSYCYSSVLHQVCHSLASSHTTPTSISWRGAGQESEKGEIAQAQVQEQGQA